MKSVFKLAQQNKNMCVESNSDMSKIVLSYLDDNFDVIEIVSEFSKEKLMIPEDEISYHKRLRNLHSKTPNTFYPDKSDVIE
jgi:hypothetical protein